MEILRSTINVGAEGLLWVYSDNVFKYFLLYIIIIVIIPIY